MTCKYKVTSNVVKIKQITTSINQQAPAAFRIDVT